MKILVCGNLGYVGPVVCRHLKKAFPDCELIGLDTGFFYSRVSHFGRIGDTYCDYQIFKDIRDISVELYKDFDAIVILSAISNDPMGNRFEKITDEINCVAVTNLIENYGKLPNKRIVFASSCSMYGEADTQAKSEIDNLAPLTAYAKSKVEVEKRLEGMDLGINTVATSLRFATACGMSDRLRLDLVLNDFVCSALVNKQINILSDGTAWRPLINVKDMALAIEWAISRERHNLQPYLAVNIGSNEWNYNIKELAETVAEKIPGSTVSFDNGAAKDKRSYKVNFDLFKSLAPNHQPVVNLEETILELAKGIKKISHLISRDFRASDFMRLNILEEHLRLKRLSPELRWL